LPGGNVVMHLYRSLFSCFLSQSSLFTRNSAPLSDRSDRSDGRGRKNCRRTGWFAPCSGEGFCGPEKSRSKVSYPLLNKGLIETSGNQGMSKRPSRGTAFRKSASKTLSCQETPKCKNERSPNIVPYGAICNCFFSFSSISTGDKTGPRPPRLAFPAHAQHPT